MLKPLWTFWFLLTVAGSAWLCSALPGDGASNRSTVFLPGRTTHGHHQIEMKCAVCHLPDGGVTDQSCIDCHAAELKASRDTHPAKKFKDPTRAVLLQKIDAQNCLSCHVEHAEEQTHPMGVTLPADYCFHCHQDVAEDRPSHADLKFDSCATAGCHNYHDNTALYENFLNKHFDAADVLEEAMTPVKRLQRLLADNPDTSSTQLTLNDADAPLKWRTSESLSEWAGSSHARMGVNCSDCHQPTPADKTKTAAGTSNEQTWIESPTHQQCSSCHDSEVGGFLAGKHGMRIASELSPMTPAMARLPVHSDAGHKTLDCSACHAAHKPDPEFAAYGSCVSCHDDEHTRNYAASSHFQLWKDELAGKGAANTGVSCATCHMPRSKNDGKVEHNQNANLRPNEKMARTVCMNCHGLPFTLNALADPNLKTNCYSTTPESTVASPKMAHDWFESKKRK